MKLDINMPKLISLFTPYEWVAMETMWYYDCEMVVASNDSTFISLEYLSAEL